MTRFDSWESYFYPETYDGATATGVLRNLRDIQSGSALRSFEYRATARRARQLRDHPELIARTYDAAHVRAIHAWLFQDVYEWAGAYRTVNMSKGITDFARVEHSAGEIDRYLGDVHRLVASTEWGRLDRDGFARAAATVFSYENHAHPFREGNGRTGRMFMEHVAEQSRFALDYTRVNLKAWNQASELSGPDIGRYEPVPDSLIPVFQAIAVERPQPDPGGTETSSTALYRASYPQSPARGVRPSAGVTPSGGRAPSRRGYGYGSAGSGLGR